MPTDRVSFYVNDELCEVEIGPHTTLLEILRDRLHLTGTKEGCGQGHCGTCTVIVNGKAVRSCTFLAKRLEGARVRTIEGLAKRGELHPVQRAFVEHGAVHCGFCTPGAIMSAVALLEANPHPSEEDIKKALERNLCRCTGYVRIIRAIEAAAQAQRAMPLPPSIPEIKPPLRTVGRPLPRPDAEAKVKGEALFAADLYFDNMLYAAVLRSAYAHARLLKVDTSRAKSMPGVVAVLTAEDVPGSKVHGVSRPDWPVLAYDKVRYVGDAVALVLAETEAQARAATEAIAVEYEPLPVVSSPEEAIAPDAPQIHEGGNLLKHIEVRRGDVAAGFASADVVIEREYRTPTTEHAFLEPEAAVARLDEHGTLVLYVGSQIPFADRRQVAASLGIPEEQVRVVHTWVGGAFGGKEDIAGQIHAALGAWVTHRPVKLVYSRQESIISHPKRHATVIRLKTGARRDGRLVALEAHILGDTGAYASLGEHVMTRTATHAAGPYDVPNVFIECNAMYTNNPPAGAFRGFGVPQSNFAIESQMDILAEELGLSPFAIRRINALRVGGTTATGQVLRESVGLMETIDRVEAEMAKYPTPEPNGEWRRGWGIACAYKNVGLGGGVDDSAGAVVEIDEEGNVSIYTGAAEVGQGLPVILPQIVAEELGVDYRQVKVVLGDTALTPDGGPTTASRQSFITGNAVRRAAIQARESLSGAVAEAWDVPPAMLVFADGQVRAGERTMSLAEAARLAKAEGRSLRAHASYTPPKTVPLGQPGDMHFAFGYATQAAEVEVNVRTGEVRVRRVIAAHDVGRALNPIAVSGQIEGGVVMGIGQALLEELVLHQGVPQNTNLRTYRIPTVTDVPEIVPILVEDPAADGPYGAKGVGEIPSIPTAAAIINAIYHACGARVYRLPATPERVREALSAAGARSKPA